jgi:hypothetical protein
MRACPREICAVRWLCEQALWLDEQVLGFAAVVGIMASVLMAVWLTT